MALHFELYVEGSSLVYRLDPRTKIVGVLVMFACSVIFTHVLYLAPMFFGMLFLYVVGGVPWRRVALLLKSLTALVVLSLIMWPLLFHPGREVFRLGPFYVTDLGLAFGVGMSFRILNMVLAPICLMLTTSQRDFVLGLRGLGLPHKGAFALATAFSFMPTVVGVGTTIIEAQRSRGLDVNEGRIIERLRRYSAILGPLIINAIRMAQQLALAVESKAFSFPGKRSSIRHLAFGRADYVVLSAYALLLVTVITLRLLGYGVFDVTA